MLETPQSIFLSGYSRIESQRKFKLGLGIDSCGNARLYWKRLAAINNVSVFQGAGIIHWYKAEVIIRKMFFSFS